MPASIPGWVTDAVFYQIFPDRFARSDRLAKPDTLEAWGSPPSVFGFQGGDLFGVAEHLDYLSDLGISALYLNPIFLRRQTTATIPMTISGLIRCWAARQPSGSCSTRRMRAISASCSTVCFTTPVEDCGSSTIPWRTARPRRMWTGSISTRSV